LKNGYWLLKGSKEWLRNGRRVDKVLMAGVEDSTPGRKRRKDGIMQTSKTQIVNPAKARAYFEQKVAFTTGPVELDNMLKEDSHQVRVVDVREAEDYAKGHIRGAINLPKAKWDSPSGLTNDKTNVVYCYSQVCHLAAKACVAFASKGFPVMELEGGFETWKEYEMEIEGESSNRMKPTAGREMHRAE
jgi:rhodanese-related sulfurtransferase